MKNILELIVCLFIVNMSYGQGMPVMDASAHAEAVASNAKSATFFGKSITQAVAQVNQLIALKDKYTEQMALVKEVNGYLKTGNQILRIKASIVDITKEYSNGLTYIKNEPLIDVESKGKIIQGYSGKLDESLSVFKDAVFVLSEDSNMTDAERITLLNNADEKLKDQKRFLIYLRNKINYTVQSLKQKQSNADFIKNEVQSINKTK